MVNFCKANACFFSRCGLEGQRHQKVSQKAITQPHSLYSHATLAPGWTQEECCTTQRSQRNHGPVSVAPRITGFPLGDTWHNLFQWIAGRWQLHVAAAAIGLGSGHRTLTLFLRDTDATQGCAWSLPNNRILKLWPHSIHVSQRQTHPQGECKTPLCTLSMSIQPSPSQRAAGSLIN